MDAFKSNIYYLDSFSKLQEIIDEIFGIKLNYANAKLFVIRKTKAKLGLPVYIQNKLTKTIEKRYREIIIRQEIPYMTDDSGKEMLLKMMDEFEADICLPLFSEKNLIGIFVLKKGSQSGIYPKEEINQIIGLKELLEVSLMNLLLKMNLQEENDLMKSIIQKKTKALKLQMQETRNLARQQADFMAVTAHEFRTPLSIALFQLEDIFGKMENDRPQYTKDLSDVRESLNNLKDLTQKLFEVQQYDLNKVELKKETTSMKDLVAEIGKGFQPIMATKKLELSVRNNLKKSDTLEVDQAQLRQVIHNLLNNAYKFTAKGRVILEADADSKHLNIRIIDSGRGIPDNMKKAIFSKFRSNSTGAGIGLGLYICQKIVELHGGKIWVEDSLDGGSAFFIHLPK